MFESYDEPYEEPVYRNCMVEVEYSVGDEEFTERVELRFEIIWEDDWCGGAINVHAVDDGQVKQWFKQKGLDPDECYLDYQIIL